MSATILQEKSYKLGIADWAGKMEAETRSQSPGWNRCGLCKALADAVARMLKLPHNMCQETYDVGRSGASEEEKEFIVDKR